MPVRNFFESLGDFFEWTFQILPILGNNMNYIIMLVMTGYAIYWFREMNRHRKAGEN